MEILSKCHSSYPRVGDQAGQQKLRRAFNAHDRKEIDNSELARLIDETAAEIIREQLRAGCDIITDGQVRAYDPISHIAAKIDGFEIGGLLRFFDTNFYYRQPKIVSRLAYKEALVSDEFGFTKQVGKEKASAVIFGPYSLLKMSVGNNDSAEVFDQLIEIYAEELQNLQMARARLVQLDEPAILQNPDDIALFQSIYGQLARRKGQIELIVALYFGNSVSLIESISGLQVDGVVFDFTYSPGLDAVVDGISANIGLGIIDGRNTKMESVDEIATKAESILKKIRISKVYLTTSCGLEFLPRRRAFDKQKLCSDAVRLLRGEKP